VRPRQISSDEGTFRKGSISRWMPMRSMTRIRNHGMSTPLSAIVSAAPAKRCGRWSTTPITMATPPRRMDCRL
jgi:hypothetical protein